MWIVHNGVSIVAFRKLSLTTECETVIKWSKPGYDCPAKRACNIYKEESENMR